MKGILSTKLNGPNKNQINRNLNIDNSRKRQVFLEVSLY